MNNYRRKILRAAAENMKEAIYILDNGGDVKQAIELIRNIGPKIEEVKNEEVDSFMNLPEQLQDADKGIKMEENADALEDICDELSDVVDRLEAGGDDDITLDLDSLIDAVLDVVGN